MLLGYTLWGGTSWINRWRIERRLAYYDPLIRRQAGRTGLPRELIRAVICVESSGDPGAVSAKSAFGLMQVRADAEADALHILKIPRGNLFDPDYNLLIGSTYLRRLHTHFGGDLYLTLAAYHMGATGVHEVLNQHPGLASDRIVAQHLNAATRSYVLKVLAHL